MVFTLLMYTFVRRIFKGHSHPQIKIAVPLENSLIQVKWQTASGDQKQQTINSQQVSIIPSHLSREIVWQRESSLLSIYLELIPLRSTM